MQHNATNIDRSLLNNEEVIQILAVDDEILSMTFLENQVSELGHSILKAENGKLAIEILEEKYSTIDVILMDREMPVMNGLTAVKYIKDNQKFRNIPIIMVTGADSVDEMREGLDAGVFYYLTKPVEQDMLRSVLSAAVREVQQSKILSEELKKHRSSFNLIETAQFKFKTLSDVESLAAFIANCFPEPERVLLGLGEILTNAIEHGNLGLGYDNKTDLIENKTWRSEINRLQKSTENSNKFAVATIAHKDDGTYLIVEDQGAGFNWKNYLEIDPSRAGDNHGRGIAQANSMSFDKLTYNENGNKAIAFVSNEKRLEW